jgi:guanylate kinase
MTPELLPLDAPDEGVLFVVTGPSGVGKTTLVRYVMARVPAIEFSVSATTRAPRPGELDGREYHFVTPARFAEMVGAGDLLEHATVYDRSYGTPREPVLCALQCGRSVLLDIDVQGARQVKSAFAECVRVFVLPPSLAALEQRLRARGDAEDALRRRMDQCDEQLRGAPEFDYVVVNDRLDVAQELLTGIFLAEVSRTTRRQVAIRRVLEQVSGRCSQ